MNLLLKLLIGIVFLFGCQKSEVNNSDALSSENTTLYQGRKCASFEILQQQLKMILKNSK